jgi:hypothetical protein
MGAFQHVFSTLCNCLQPEDCHIDPSGLLQVKKTDAGGRLTLAESALVHACNLEVDKVCFSQRHLSFVGCASATLSTVHCDFVI